MRLLAALFALCSCAHPGSASPAAGPLPWARARQLVVVVPETWDASLATLWWLEREAGSDWRAVDSGKVTVGKSGSAWGLGLHPPPRSSEGPVKREGDGRSPAGVFEIGQGFGYADAAATRLQYQPMSRESWCVDVPESPLYNRIVDAREVGDAGVSGSSEPMRRDLHLQDDAYRVGFVVRHNAAAKPGAGSCIFVHQQRQPGRPTAGCTALEPAKLDALFAWLDAARAPVLVLLPRAQYDALRAEWALPRL